VEIGRNILCFVLIVLSVTSLNVSRKVRGDKIKYNIVCLVVQEKLKTKRINCFKLVHFIVVKPRPHKEVCKPYTIRFLFNAIGFPPGSSGPYTCTQKERTVIFIKRNNTEHRTHKIGSETYKTIKKLKG
jgi:hypothetical protein